MKHSPPGEAFTNLVLQIFRINGMLLQAGDRMAAPAGQSSARWQVMGVIDHGPMTVAEAARRMGLTRQSVQRIADLLAQEGLAAYEHNPADKRAQLISLTSRGKKILRTIEAEQYQWANRLGEKLGLPELEELSKMLGRVEQLLSPEEPASK